MNMNESSVDYKIGQLDARLDSLEETVHSIDKTTKNLSEAMMKGKGLLIGLILTASGLGAFLSTMLKKWVS